MTKYTRNSQTISGRLHDELVMMDINQGRYFSLNPVASRIWDLLERPMLLDEICGLLMAEYQVDQGRCRDEVRDHLKMMIRLGLVNATE